MKNNRIKSFYACTSFFLITAFCLSGCKVYRQNIILQTEESIKTEEFKTEVAKLEGAYEIKPGDKLLIEVFTNEGERILDPNLELGATGGGGGGQAQLRPSKEFEVFHSGYMNLPMIGKVKAAGFSVNSFQEHLEELYSAFYIEPYVRVDALNRRVIVLGAVGGQVIPLENEKMNLLEVLALSGGLTKDSKGNNIRLIRGPLEEPSVQVINLSTIEGMQQASLSVLPGDIIYVEPLRRVLTESIRDIAPIIGIVTNVVTLFIVIQSLN